MMLMDDPKACMGRCGYIALLGRSNVGKSTLLNRILGEKLSITSRKQQTTRVAIRGIKTQNRQQAIYVDTPGVQAHASRALNRRMNRLALEALYDVDVVVWLVDQHIWKPDDHKVLCRLKSLKKPIIIAINKVDCIAHKPNLLPTLKTLGERLPQAVAIIPLSAKTGNQVDVLERVIAEYLPEGIPLFPEDQLTDRSEAFLVTEWIREVLMDKLHQEIPYSLSVRLENLERRKTDKDKPIVYVQAVIWVETTGQKAIILGKSGLYIKDIACQSRLRLEQYFQQQVFLRLWVKVKKGWPDRSDMIEPVG